ncbi:RlpA-like double-psi beta-barrel domain-containing protein [Streptomyces sp. NPDC047072]|uniref:RlpA-like double-psi beta-barrel domain-containing protein n=1 Tax=Streptomyces sp. NPDC047072 TaxID=3154809 RepID=UPI0033DC1920
MRSHSVVTVAAATLLTTLMGVSTARADVGTAAHYAPPYLPTACYGKDGTRLPSGGLVAAAGDGVWDGGAACGRTYQVRCVSAAQPGVCVPGRTIQVEIVDYAPSSVSPASASSTTLVLSDTAFDAVTRRTAESITIEFQEV